MFKFLEIKELLAVNKVPACVILKNLILVLNFLLYQVYRYNSDLFEYSKYLDSSQKESGATFTCSCLNFPVLWNKNWVFTFDSHCQKRNRYSGPNGDVVLLEF